MEEARLRQFLQEFDFASQAPELSAADQRVYKYYLLGGCVIGCTLGGDWFARQITAKKKPTAHFRADAIPDQRPWRFISRVGELGELIYNLQNVEGFDGRLASIRTAKGDGVEAGIAELAAGKLFKVNDIPFRFVKESKVKRADYDIEYATLDSRLGRCEVKCKLQSNDFTVNGIRNILKAAKDQLPKGDGTGIVLLRIPEEWWDPWAKPAGLTAVSSAVEEFFAKEKTTRISSVLVLQHRTDIREGHMAQFLLCKEHPNPHCSIKSGLPPLREAPPPRSVWTPLLAVVN